MSYRKTTQTTTVQYDCNHFRVYLLECMPQVGERVVCIRCNTSVTVMKTRLDYRTRCLTCTHSRNHGPAKLTAEIAGSKHHKRYPSHTVIMEYAGTKIHSWEPQRSELFAKSLPGRPVNDLDLPPF